MGWDSFENIPWKSFKFGAKRPLGGAGLNSRPRGAARVLQRPPPALFLYCKMEECAELSEVLLQNLDTVLFMNSPSTGSVC